MQKISYNDYTAFVQRMTPLSVEVIGLMAGGLAAGSPEAVIGAVQYDQRIWMEHDVVHNDATAKVPGQVAVFDVIRDGQTHAFSPWLDMDEVVPWINAQRNPNDQIPN